MTPRQRMMRLGMKIVDLCQEMDKRGRHPHYMEVAAVFHGDYSNSNVTMSVEQTLTEVERERGVEYGEK